MLTSWTSWIVTIAAVRESAPVALNGSKAHRAIAVDWDARRTAGSSLVLFRKRSAAPAKFSTLAKPFDFEVVPRRQKGGAAGTDWSLLTTGLFCFFLALPEVRIVMQHHVQQGIVDFQASVVFDEAELAKLVHKHAYA